MHYAAVHRVARLGGKPLGRWAIFHSRACCVGIGIILFSTLLLLNTQAASAQSRIPLRAPIEYLPYDITLQDGTEDGTEEAASRVIASTSSEIVHEIVAGDTLTTVAQQYDVEPAKLAAYNQILDDNIIVIGQKLRIPSAGVAITELAVEPAVESMPGADGYHVVRQGESLGAIARLYGLTLEKLMVLNEIDDSNLVRIGTMLRLTEDVELPTATIQALSAVAIYQVKQGDTIAKIAQAYYTTIEQILQDNELANENVRVGQELRIFTPATALEAFGIDAPVDGARKIVIDLSDQTLTAYQGDVVVLHSLVSTGKDATPTLVGDFAVYLKYVSQDMSGDDYFLPGVPWVMYYDGGFGIHGAYWHANFGIPTSHGCTNMTISDARALYRWAPIGTRVLVQY